MCFFNTWKEHQCNRLQNPMRCAVRKAVAVLCQEHQYLLSVFPTLAQNVFPGEMSSHIYILLTEKKNWGHFSGIFFDVWMAWFFHSFFRWLVNYLTNCLFSFGILNIMSGKLFRKIEFLVPPVLSYLICSLSITSNLFC